ncbi:MAG TPA: endolytic transglycosylase MltG [Methylomusa anaerophila]|nr:endolytic transglycosylase MltG [Methylomusa anaerophila]HML87267.1 endolytic transglycosylase MltG [Methylomusa anaerophila]
MLISSILYACSMILPVSSAAHEPIIINIESGMSTQDIGQLLYKQRLIRSVFVFRIAAKLEKLENSLQAGEYELSPNMSINKIVSTLAAGQNAYQEVTIPEGYTVDQIAALLNEKNLVKADQFKSLAKTFAPYQYMTANPLIQYQAEGFIFPDTYQIAKGMTEEQILAMMVKQFDTKFTAAMREKAEERGMTIREVVILASLVEKEAKLEQEGPIIAGVFANRVKQGMPLQSCATIQYILGYPKPELTIEDTQIPSPYNTYQNMGLPPGPIANPGMTAIRAVLNANGTEYLYFVADKNGKHHFSKTYEEHLAAIEQVQM